MDPRWWFSPGRRRPPAILEPIKKVVSRMSLAAGNRVLSLTVECPVSMESGGRWPLAGVAAQ